jgi:diguanylate cyclase (GGDEF)-like protein
MDRLTLFSMQGGLLIFLGAVTYSAWRVQKRPHSDNGPMWFSLGFVIGGIGLLLQAYRGIIPAFYAIVLGNFLFLMNYVFMERALAITTKRRSSMIWLLGVDIAVVAAYAYLTYIRPDVMTRTLIAIVVMPVMQLPIWGHLLRSKDTTIRPALRAMAAVLAAHALMNFIRIIGMMMLRNADVWFTWFGIISVAGVALSFLWIDALRIREELERNAMTDPLTGLLNRRALDDFGLRALSRASRLGLPCSALAIDLNRFKQINDTYGHSAGDRALCAVAASLRSSLRLSDLATRVGGDEFLVLLPDADERIADEVAARLRKSIHSATVETVAGERFSIAVSIGCVTLRGDKMTIADLFHASDVKLYAEKQSTRREEKVLQGKAWHQVTERSEAIGLSVSNA